MRLSAHVTCDVRTAVEDNHIAGIMLAAMARFLDAVTSAQMSERVEQLIASDGKLRVVNYLLGPAGMLAWARSVGVATDEELADCVPPLPAVALRSIVADRRIAPFLYTGFMDPEYAAGLFRQHAAGPPALPGGPRDWQDVYVWRRR